jgi:hypothetical protein
MLLYLQKYSLRVTYRKGSELYIADTLSRAYLKDTGGSQPQPDVLNVKEVNFIKKLEAISAIEDIANSKRRLEEIKQSTRRDPVMKKLLETIRSGWPEERRNVEVDLKPYFDIRTELVCEDGFIMKGDRIVIPSAERRTVMKNLHISHLGIEGTLAKAREYVYWPRMNEQVKEMITSCDICNQVRSQQRKEPLIQQQVPSRAWAVVSTDLFEFNKVMYLIVVDHFSNYFEYEALSAATSGLVIRAMEDMEYRRR